MIEIQVQDMTGNWRTYTITQNNTQLIIMAIKSLKDQFPAKRIRAVDSDGRLVDLVA